MTPVEAALIEKVNKIEEIARNFESALTILHHEVHCLRVSLGIKPQDEWYNLLTEVNNETIKREYGNSLPETIHISFKG